MSIPSDHKALIFIGAVAVLGAAVRVTRVAVGSANAAPQPALEHQIQASDSAARAGRSKSRGKSPRGKPSAHASQTEPGGIESSNARRLNALLDRPGYVGKRLDMDVATAAQIDSLPGVTPLMARRIVVDRMTRGPFLSLDGLRRVSGAGPRFVQRIDSLVTFSGVYHSGTPADTVIPKRRSRAKRATRPAALQTTEPRPGPWRHAIGDIGSPDPGAPELPRRAM